MCFLIIKKNPLGLFELHCNKAMIYYNAITVHKQQPICDLKTS